MVAISRMVGKGREVERPLNPQRDHQDQHRKRDRERQSDVDQKAGIGRNSTHRIATMPIAKPTSRPFLRGCDLWEWFLQAPNQVLSPRSAAHGQS
jgi:hypothetical protein